MKKAKLRKISPEMIAIIICAVAISVFVFWNNNETQSKILAVDVVYILAILAVTGIISFRLMNKRQVFYVFFKVLYFALFWIKSSKTSGCISYIWILFACLAPELLNIIEKKYSELSNKQIDNEMNNERVDDVNHVGN